MNRENKEHIARIIQDMHQGDRPTIEDGRFLITLVQDFDRLDCNAFGGEFSTLQHRSCQRVHRLNTTETLAQIGKRLKLMERLLLLIADRTLAMTTSVSWQKELERQYEQVSSGLSKLRTEEHE